MSADPNAIIAEAREWIGTPFQHHQATKGVGTDCIGLIAGVAAATGITSAWFDGRAAPFKGYGKTPDPEILLRACRTFMEQITRLDAGAGDVLVMRVPLGDQPQHFAIISRMAMDRPSHMIHALNVVGRVVEQPIDSKWWSRVLYAFRFRDGA